MIPVMEMANVKGSLVKVDNINFSFYFSGKYKNKHGIRVKISWNRERVNESLIDGSLCLHGNYEYIPNKKSKKVSDSDLNKAREFFKKYKVLFAGVWEGFISHGIVIVYLGGYIPFKDMVIDIFGEDIGVNNLQELEQYVRENHVFNMND